MTPLNQSLTQSKESQVVEAVFIDTAGSREASDSSAGQVQPPGPTQPQGRFNTQQAPGSASVQPVRGAFRHLSNDDQVRSTSEATVQGFKPVMAGASQLENTGEVLLVPDSESCFTRVHGLQSSTLHRHASSAEENAGEKQSQAVPRRAAADYPSAKGPHAGAYAAAGAEGGLQSCDSGDAFRHEEYLSGHGQSDNFQERGPRSNRVVNNAHAGPYDAMASSGKHERATDSDFFNLTREDEESQIEQSKKGLSAHAAMKISESNRAGSENEEPRLEKSPGALQAYQIL